MNDFLTKIIESKSKRIEIAKAKTPLFDLKEKAFDAREKSVAHRLRKALSEKDKVNVIAEIKRASPSKGIIDNKINVAEVAKNYKNGGACAISILTEEDFFKGSLEDLRKARETVSLPILRKDFIFDEYQIYEAAEAGADAVLLIVAMLDVEVLTKLQHLAEQVLDLDALVEVHTMAEMETAKNVDAKIIGINNRNLQSFKVSLDVSRRLVKHAPEDALLIAESGLRTREDLTELKKLGFDGFLIGESLMKAVDAENELRKFTA